MNETPFARTLLATACPGSSACGREASNLTVSSIKVAITTQSLHEKEEHLWQRPMSSPPSMRLGSLG